MEGSLPEVVEAAARGAAAGCDGGRAVVAAAVSAAVASALRTWRALDVGAAAGQLLEQQQQQQQQAPLGFMEEALGAAAELLGKKKVGVAEAKAALRRRGSFGEDLARRLGKLSKARNVVAHPDVGLVVAIRALGSGDETGLDDHDDGCQQASTPSTTFPSPGDAGGDADGADRDAAADLVDQRAAIDHGPGCADEAGFHEGADLDDHSPAGDHLPVRASRPLSLPVLGAEQGPLICEQVQSEPGGGLATDADRTYAICYGRSIADEEELVRRLQEESARLAGQSVAQGKAMQAACRRLAGIARADG